MEVGTAWVLRSQLWNTSLADCFVFEEAATLEEAMQETKWSQRAGRSLQFFSPHICSGRRDKAYILYGFHKGKLSHSAGHSAASHPFTPDNPSFLGLNNNQELVKRMIISASKISA